MDNSDNSTEPSIPGKNLTSYDNQRSIKTDATVTSADKRFPTEVNLLNDAIQKREQLTGTLYPQGTLEVKPLTHTENLEGQYKFYQVAQNQGNVARKTEKNPKEDLPGVMKRRYKSERSKARQFLTSQGWKATRSL